MNKYLKLSVHNAIPILLILFVLGMIYISFITIFDGFGIPNKKHIIEKFEENEYKFEQIIIELLSQEYERVSFKKEKKEVLIIIYEKPDDNLKVIELNKDEKKQYKKTIDLMEQLNIIYISKDEGNISFTMTKFGQKIVKIENEEIYKWGHKVVEMDKIKNNWYYTKED